MRKEFLNFILCPICRSADFELQVKSENNIEIREGQLLCRQCQTTFSIKKGILFFDKNISPEARREKMATEEEIEKQKDLMIFQDGKWLLGFPFNKKMGIDMRTERMTRLSTENALLFLKNFNWPKGADVLELGASNCWLTARLAKKYKCAALDISTKFPRGLEAADVFIKHKNVFFERIVADMKELPFRDNSFSIVLINAALHHSSDLIQTLKEVYRVLSPKGQLVLLNEPSVGWFGSRERTQIIRDREGGFNENRYTIREWIGAFTREGFKSKIYLPSNFLEILQTRGRIFQILSSLLKLMPSFLKKIIINKSEPIVLTVFDGFFNAAIYKGK